MSPQKQVYVKKEDLPIWEAAEKYGNSVSEVVIAALRKYVEAKQAQEDCMIEETIKTENDYESGTKKFIGRLVAEKYTQPKDRVDLDFRVYQTRKGVLVWGRFANGDYGIRRADYITAKTVADLRDEEIPGVGKIPDDLLDEAAEEIGEDLDFLDV